MPPKNDRNAIPAGAPQKDQIVEKAFETGAVLQQASASQHERINVLESANRFRQGAAIDDGRTWTQGSNSLMISGCDQRMPCVRKLGDEYLKEGIITKVVLAVVTTKEHFRLVRNAKR